MEFDFSYGLVRGCRLRLALPQGLYSRFSGTGIPDFTGRIDGVALRDTKLQG